MTSIQEWLDNKYSTRAEKEQVKEIKGVSNLEGGELDLRAYQNLETIIIDKVDDVLKSPLTKLELGSHPNLTRLNCQNNKLTELNVSGCPNLVHLSVSFNELNSVDFLKQLPHPEKLTSLNLARNNFQSTTLDFLSPFTNLKGLTLGTKKEKIEEGVYNRFTGSLKPLKKMTDLSLLCIAGTDVDSGLEYLPLSKISGYEGRIAPMLDCRQLVPHAKVKAIKAELQPFNYDIEAWQLAHPEKMLVAQPELFAQGPNKEEQWNKELTRKIASVEKELAECRQENYGGDQARKQKIIKRTESKLKLLKETQQKLQQGKFEDLPPPNLPAPTPDNNDNQPPKSPSTNSKASENNWQLILMFTVIGTITIIIGYVIFSKKKKKQYNYFNKS